jgi:hypothetical protein
MVIANQMEIIQMALSIFSLLFVPDWSIGFFANVQTAETLFASICIEEHFQYLFLLPAIRRVVAGQWLNSISELGLNIAVFLFFKWTMAATPQCHFIEETHKSPKAGDKIRKYVQSRAKNSKIIKMVQKM